MYYMYYSQQQSVSSVVSVQYRPFTSIAFFLQLNASHYYVKGLSYATSFAVGHIRVCAITGASELK